jgi:hypothetical protein
MSTYKEWELLAENRTRRLGGVFAVAARGSLDTVDSPAPEGPDRLRVSQLADGFV